MRSAVTLAILLVTCAALAAADPPKNEPPIEQPPADPKAPKVVLIAGSNFFKAGEHEYVGGCAVLMNLLKQNGVTPVLALDWPKKAETLDGAKAVVFFFDGAEKHQALKGDRVAQIQKLMDAKVGLVQLHQTVEYTKDFSDKARGWGGGTWEKGTGARAHWVTEFDTFPDHPTTRGVTKFKIDDGYLFKNTFVPELKGVTPLLRTWNPKATDKPTGAQDVVAWTYERPEGGRAFSFTGAHLHASFGQEGYRRFLTNGILWTAGIEVPKDGAKIELVAATLTSYLKPPAKKP